MSLRNSKDEIYDALEMIIAGPEKKTPVVPEEEEACGLSWQLFVALNYKLS